MSETVAVLFAVLTRGLPVPRGGRGSAAWRGPASEVRARCSGCFDGVRAGQQLDLLFHPSHLPSQSSPGPRSGGGPRCVSCPLSTAWRPFELARGTMCGIHLAST